VWNEDQTRAMTEVLASVSIFVMADRMNEAGASKTRSIAAEALQASIGRLTRVGSNPMPGRS
jgi:hypothetical protein